MLLRRLLRGFVLLSVDRELLHQTVDGHLCLHLLPLQQRKKAPLRHRWLRTHARVNLTRHIHRGGNRVTVLDNLVTFGFHLETLLKSHAHIFRHCFLLGQRGHLRAQRVLREESARVTRLRLHFRGLSSPPYQVVLHVAGVGDLGQSLGERGPRLQRAEHTARCANHVHDGSRHLGVQVEGRGRDRTLHHKLDRPPILPKGSAFLLALHDQGSHKEL